MKYTFVLITALLLFMSSCGTDNSDTMAIPEGLAEKQALLKEKKLAQRELEKFIAELEAAVMAQDPTAGVRRKELVTTLPVKRTTFQRFVDLQGVVQAEDMTGIVPEAGGRILSLTIKEGQTVSKGQLVAKIDVESIRKQMSELETALELAKTTYERQQRLWDQNIGSEIQVLQAKNSKERLEKNMDLLRLQMSKENVYAPVSGQVERLMMQGGEVASPGMPIAMILNTSKLKVVLDVPETYLGKVRKGDRVKVSFPALDLEQMATVNLISATINPSNRTFKVEININKTSNDLKPNLLSLVAISDYEEKNVIALPLELVQQEIGGKDFVFVKMDTPEGPVASKVYVKTGQAFQGQVIITEGLEGTEEVIAEGARGLVDKAPIEVVKAAISEN